MIDPPRAPNGAWSDPSDEHAKLIELAATPYHDHDNDDGPSWPRASRPQWLDLGLIMGLISLLISMGSTFWGWVPKTAVMEIQIQNQQLQIKELQSRLQSLADMRILEAELRGKFEERLKTLEAERKR